MATSCLLKTKFIIVKCKFIRLYYFKFQTPRARRSLQAVRVEVYYRRILAMEDKINPQSQRKYTGSKGRRE